MVSIAGTLHRPVEIGQLVRISGERDGGSRDSCGTMFQPRGAEVTMNKIIGGLMLVVCSLAATPSLAQPRTLVLHVQGGPGIGDRKGTFWGSPCPR